MREKTRIAALLITIALASPLLGVGAAEEANEDAGGSEIVEIEEPAPGPQPVAAPPGFGTDDPWVDANGDEMYGALDMGPYGVFLNGRLLSATTGGDIQFDGQSICLETTGCSGSTLQAQFPIEVANNVVSLSTSGCGPGELWKWTGSSWACQPDQDTDTTYTAGNGLALGGTTFEIDDSTVQLRVSASCASGEAIRAIASDGTVTCEVDDDTHIASLDWADVTAKPAGFDDDVDDDTLASLACSSAQLAKWDGASWTCAADGDTTYDGSDFALSGQACPSGELVASVDGSGALTCSPDSDTTYTAGDGLELSGTTFDADTSVLQARVDGTCREGTALSAVLGDGSVACRTLWGIAGNAGTSPGADFLGTTDDARLDLRVDDVLALRLEPTGQTPNVVAGNASNSARAGVQGATIAGGSGSYPNEAAADYASVGGGLGNTAAGYASMIGAGSRNDARDSYAGVVAGYANDAHGYASFVGAGGSNNASGSNSFVGAGYGNEASGYRSVIGGGNFNEASSSYSHVGGGYRNTASGSSSFVGAGSYNDAPGTRATVVGGYENNASGLYAAIPGGFDNQATGDRSFAAGSNAQALHDGAFVWADDYVYDFDSTAADQFRVRAQGGVQFVTGISGTTPTAGVELASGSGSWSSLSDRAAKEDIQALDGQAVLDQLTGLPVYEWSYIAQEEGVRHVGPMAQDFHAAFGVGEDETRISNVDADGVALAAIQGLNAKVDDQATVIDEQARTIEEQEQTLEAHRQLLEEMDERLSALETGQGQPTSQDEDDERADASPLAAILEAIVDRLHLS